MQNKIYIKRSSRKSIALKIDSNGNIFVYCPLRYSTDKIINLLQEKKQWIQTHLQRVQVQNETNKDFISYKKILILGKDYDIKCSNNKINIGNLYSFDYSKDYIDALKKWLQKRAGEILKTKLEYWANIMKTPYNRVGLTSARKKWGSCDNKHMIRLNFRLIMLPMECIDYVCVHELSHILQLNHSKKFWQNVSKYIPNYKEIKKSVSQYSFVLKLF